MRRTGTALLSMMLVGASPGEMRDLPVPAGKGWLHAQTGLALTATLDGMPRSMLRDTTATEHDVMAEFATRDRSTVASVFLFRPATFNVGMWFERAEAAILNRAVFGGVKPVSAAMPFAAPGHTPAGALRRVYIPGQGPFRSTALAVIPLSSWLVVVRLSSKTFTPEEADAHLDRIIDAIRWPAPLPVDPVAKPIAGCATPLSFAEARRAVLRKDRSLAWLALGTSMAKAEAARRATPIDGWCSDPSSSPDYGVYRAIDRPGYIMALQDAGRVVNVDALTTAPSTKVTSYRVTLSDVDGSSRDYGRFDALPSPTQVLAILTAPAATDR